MSELANWIVRPPWPDEISRLKSYFGLKSDGPGFERIWLWVVATGRPERMVSLIQLIELSGSDGWHFSTSMSAVTGSIILQRGRLWTKR